MEFFTENIVFLIFTCNLLCDVVKLYSEGGDIMNQIDLHTGTINIYEGCDIIQFTRLKIDKNTPTVKSAKHIHPHCELYFLLDGEVDFAVEDDERHLCGGDIVLIRGGKYHNTLSIEPKPYDHCFIYLSEKSFPRFSADVRLQLGEMMDPKAHGNYLRPSAASFVKIRELLIHIDEMVHETEQRPDTVNSLAKYAAMLELIELIAVEYRNTYEKIKPDGVCEPEVRSLAENASLHPVANNAVRYIDRNFRTIGDINEVAAACKVTHSYLSRIFKENLGMTPSAYLRQKRLAYAKLMLLNGYDVTSTCYYSGFADYSYFIQVFRSEEGMTPLAYQRKHGGSRSEQNEPD